MFGLSEREMEFYKNSSQEFATKDVIPSIMGHSKFVTPMIKKGKKEQPDTDYANQMIGDIETVITLLISHMCYEYAYLQTHSDDEEAAIIKLVHNKYESRLIDLFIKYGIAFSTDIVQEVVGNVVLELPYIYMAALDSDKFDEKAFEEKMDAYEEYVKENFSEESDSQPDPDDQDEEDTREE